MLAIQRKYWDVGCSHALSPTAQLILHRVELWPAPKTRKSPTDLRNYALDLHVSDVAFGINMSKVKFRSHEVEQGKTQPATNTFLHLTIELKRWRLHVGPTYVGRRHASGFKSETNQVIWDLTFPWKFKQAHCRSHQPLNAMGRPCESTTPRRRSSPTQWRSPSCWWSSHRSRTEPRRTSPGTTCGGSKVQETPRGKTHCEASWCLAIPIFAVDSPSPATVAFQSDEWIIPKSLQI